ncbi:hypothetical protein QN277_025909 [Acacia crassicarpa]|uniref:GATA-type domain-containing protein n=1 Tax=Acacia crassicarpa TaxID=499986 RepID=A0AAE1JAW7_9FABA|nr:hypothetical protein QN277_025909 [Acacia crassicarpa]
MNPPGNPADGETPPSSQSQTQLRQTHVTANNQSHIINEPSLPLNNAGGIEEPRQPPLGAIQESHIINEQVSPPHQQHALERTFSEELKYQLLLLSKEDQLLQDQQRAPRVSQESHTIKKPSRVNQESHTMKKPSSSSKGRRGRVVALRCARCKNTSTTQWRSDPTGEKWQPLCNACWNGLNRVEDTRAAWGLQSLNTSWPPPMLSTARIAEALHVLRNTDEDMEDNDDQFVPKNNFLRPCWVLDPLNIVPPPPEMPPPAAPEEAPEMEGSGQNCTDKTRENSPEA